MSGEREQRRLQRAHRRARERGVSRPLHALARAVLTPVLRFWVRLHATGAQHIPAAGPAIVACNHKSFLDPFFIGLAAPRAVHYMAKKELFEPPFGGLLSRLGAFPVRRGEADADAIATARAILADGRVLVVFPEGTRVEDADALGSPHHGAGRLAIESGAPIVPAAIAGTGHLWLGPILRPRRVQLAFLEPVDPLALADRPDAVDALVDGVVWPAVREQYGRQLAAPGLALAALAALGVGGKLVARRRQRARKPRLLGIVEPLKLRRGKARRRRLDRILRRRHP